MDIKIIKNYERRNVGVGDNELGAKLFKEWGKMAEYLLRTAV